MTKEQVDVFEKVQGQLDGLHTEISALSKKSQNETLNKFKLKFVNQVLIQANALLGEMYRPFPDFETFDDDDLPTNSDAALILTQYLNCLEKLRADNIMWERTGKWYWKIDGQSSGIQTMTPKRIREK